MIAGPAGRDRVVESAGAATDLGEGPSQPTNEACVIGVSG
jgi:hypothetical protein